MLHAPRGIGRTQVAIGTVWAVASGGGFLLAMQGGSAVLFLDDPGADLQARLISSGKLDIADPDYLKIAASDLTPFGLPI